VSRKRRWKRKVEEKGGRERWKRKVEEKGGRERWKRKVEEKGKKDSKLPTHSSITIRKAIGLIQPHKPHNHQRHQETNHRAHNRVDILRPIRNPVLETKRRRVYARVEGEMTWHERLSKVVDQIGPQDAEQLREDVEPVAAEEFPECGLVREFLGEDAAVEGGWGVAGRIAGFEDGGCADGRGSGEPHDWWLVAFGMYG
jgi:hypothetical protein